MVDSSRLKQKKRKEKTEQNDVLCPDCGEVAEYPICWNCGFSFK